MPQVCPESALKCPESAPRVRTPSPEVFCLAPRSAIRCGWSICSRWCVCSELLGACKRIQGRIQPDASIKPVSAHVHYMGCSVPASPIIWRPLGTRLTRSDAIWATLASEELLIRTMQHFWILSVALPRLVSRRPIAASRGGDVRGPTGKQAALCLAPPRVVPSQHIRHPSFRVSRGHSGCVARPWPTRSRYRVISSWNHALAPLEVAPSPTPAGDGRIPRSFESCAPAST